MPAPNLIPLTPLAGLLALVLGSMAFFAARWKLRGRPATERVRQRGESAFLSVLVMEWYYWITEPVVRLLVWFGVTPNSVTALSLVPAAAAGALFWAGHYATAGWMYLLCGTLDVLDGRLARATGMQSRAGAFFDSTLDRYAELAVYIGLLWDLRHTPALLWAAAALAGSLMTSYTRARGEALGVNAPAGGMQRAERVLYLGLPAILAPVADVLAPHWGGGRLLVVASLAVIAVSANWTAVRRAVHVFRALQRGKPSAKAAEG